MRVLITGGAGFIGSHTAEALIKRGYEVRILDNLTEPVHRSGKPLFIPEGAEFIKGDVRNKEDWIKALKDVEIVYHFAAYQDYLPDFSKFFHVNTVGIALLYEIAVEKKIPLKKVIVASSQAVYGEGKYLCPKDGIQYPNIRLKDQLDTGSWNIPCPKCGGRMKPRWTDESKVNSQNQYAISKYSQELIALNLGHRYGIPTVCLRYSIVQGPRQSFYNAYSGACRIFSLSYYFGKQPIIYEDGNQLRDYVNIEDVVNANLLMLEKPEVDFQVFNVGGGKAYTVTEFTQIVADVFGVKIKSNIPGEYRFGDTRHILSDISKLKSLGWEPKYSPEKSVKDYKDWLYSQNVGKNILAYAEERMKELNVIRYTYKQTK
ncbi:NAD-dependent epimerase/dehydratase family protein [candidate division WOR-3 bacterium]|nr:NAD-dependent epimerase/dehydratase family protein [candidate division WOR-3 bacterium]